MATPSRLTFGAVFLGGALGTLGRAVLVQAAPVPPGSWPWATFVANLVAAGLLGAVIGRASTRRSGWWRPFLATGLCGGLSTFSTLQLELVELVDAGAYAVAAAYAGLSVVLGVGMIALGLRGGARGRR